MLKELNLIFQSQIFKNLFSIRAATPLGNGLVFRPEGEALSIRSFQVITMKKMIFVHKKAELLGASVLKWLHSSCVLKWREQDSYLFQEQWQILVCIKKQNNINSLKNLKFPRN